MPRRIAQLLIAGELICLLLKHGSSGFRPIANCLPDDAELEDVFSAKGKLIALVFSSEHFPEHYPLVTSTTALREVPVLQPIKTHSLVCHCPVEPSAN